MPLVKFKFWNSSLIKSHNPFSRTFFFKTNLPFAHYSLYFFTVLCHSFWHCTFTLIFWCLVSRIILLNIFRCVFAKSLQNINLNFPHILVEKCVKQISIFLNLMINDLTNVSIISLENLFFVPCYNGTNSK